MQKLLLAVSFLVLATFSSYSQTKKKTTANSSLSFQLEKNRLIFSDTVHLQENHEAGRLSQNARTWFQENYQSADNRILIDNPGGGVFSVTGIIHSKNKNDKEADGKDVFFSIDLYLSNGVYTYKIYDLSYMDEGKKILYADVYEEQLHPEAKPQWTESERIAMLNYMRGRVDTMLGQLKAYMGR